MMRKFVTLAALLLVAGCASRDPRLYTLTERPGQIRPFPKHVVVILPPAIPRYLDRQEIMRNTGDGTRAAMENEWWDEPLRQMVARVLAADLAQRLPPSDVLTADDMAVPATAAHITLEVQGFDKVGDQVILTGHLEVQANAQRTLDPVTVTVPVSGGGIPAQVNAMSVALAEVADMAAAHLTGTD